MQAIVQNQGNIPTQNGFFTDLYADHLPTGIGDLAGSIQFWVNDPIAAGAIVTLTTVITEMTSLSGMSVQSMSSASEITSTLYAQVDSSGAVSESDDANNIYATGTEVCLASSDAYESDDTAEAAETISVDQTHTHNFDSPGDRDWIKFSAEVGKTYLLRTSNLGASADTYLYLYDTDRTTLLASNDDYGGSLASQIEWTAPTNGAYHVLVQHWNPNAGGCGTKYDISVTKQAAEPTPTHTPTATRTWTPRPTDAWTPTPTRTPTYTPTSTPTQQVPKFMHVYVPAIAKIFGQAITGVLFEDRFNLYPRPEWEFTSGTWRVVEGRLTADEVDQWVYAHVGNSNWTDYEVQVEIRQCGGGKTWNEIVLRRSLDGEILVSFDDAGTRFVLHQGSLRQNLTPINGPLVRPTCEGVLYKVRVVGDQYSIYADDMLLVTMQDATLDHGQVGIGYLVQGEARKYIDNFKVKALTKSCITDEFSAATLSPEWVWVDPLGDSNYSLTANPGYLHIQTPDGDHDMAGWNTNAPRMVRSIYGDFQIETRVIILIFVE